MIGLKVYLSLAFLVCCASAKTIAVSSAAQLRAALGSAEAGDVIDIADGTYSGGAFTATKSGATGSPIVIKGSRKAVLSGSPYGFYVNKANYLNITGFTVANAMKGIVTDGSNHNVIDNVEVHTIQQEGIHFRRDSADNILQNSFIHDTGTKDAGYGEGVYLGSAVKNWQGGPDKSDRNQVLNNRIGPNVAAECIDIKEGSTGGIIRGNTFTGKESGANGADSWVDVKGSGYTIENNTGTNPLRDGFQIHHIDGGGANSGCNNIIQNNHCSGLPSGGVCAVNSAGCTNTVKNNA